MRESDISLSHQLTDITVAELEGDVPSYSLDDEEVIEVAPFEECWCLRGQLGHTTDYL